MVEVLDLHCTRHNMVRQNLIRFIEDNWGKDVEAEIVTGNSQSMKDIVIEVLNEYQLSHRIGDSFGINNGFIKTDI